MKLFGKIIRFNCHQGKRCVSTNVTGRNSRSLKRKTKTYEINKCSVCGYEREYHIKFGEGGKIEYVD